MLVWERSRVVRLYMFLQAMGKEPDRDEMRPRGMLMLRSSVCRLRIALHVAAQPKQCQSI